MPLAQNIKNAFITVIEEEVERNNITSSDLDSYILTERLSTVLSRLADQFLYRFSNNDVDELVSITRLIIQHRNERIINNTISESIEPVEDMSIPTSIPRTLYGTYSTSWSDSIISKSRRSKKVDKAEKPKDNSFRIEVGPVLTNLLKFLPNNSIKDVIGHSCSSYRNWPVNYIEVRDEELLEYREPNSDKIQVARVGRILGRIADVIGLRNDSHIEQFTNQYKALIQIESGKINLEIVTGVDIPYWYSEENQINNSTLGQSCMRYKECEKYINLYSELPQLSMAIYKKGDKVAARALLWDLGDIKIMDRIYYSEDWHVYMFKKWAGMNRYLCKHIQGHREKTTFELNKNIFEFYLEVNLNLKEDIFYPYIDTFSFTSDFKTFRNWEKPNDFKLCSTQGEYRIKFQNDYYDKSQLIWSHYNNGYIFKNDAVNIPGIGWVNHFDLVYINDEPYLKSLCWCDHKGLWHNTPPNWETIINNSLDKIGDSQEPEPKKVVRNFGAPGLVVNGIRMEADLAVSESSQENTELNSALDELFEFPVSDTAITELGIDLNEIEF